MTADVKRLQNDEKRLLVSTPHNKNDFAIKLYSAYKQDYTIGTTIQVCHIT